MDVKRIIKTLRYVRNSLKFLLTPVQRKLLRMQAYPMLVDIKEPEKILKFKDIEH
jgi:hypothetical protein